MTVLHNFFRSNIQYKLMMSSSLAFPPGFRFHPTDEELIDHYLKPKASTLASFAPIIADVNIYKFNPWELPGKAYFGDAEWFFFSPRDRKYPNGGRPNRAAASGFWKATGTDKPILSSTGTQCLGVKKSLVFYKGRPPKGEKTNWTMLEYRLLDDSLQSNNRLKGSMRLDDWVLCRVRQKQCSANNSPLSIKNSNSPQSCVPGSLQGQDNVTKFYEYELQLLHSLMAPNENEAEIYQESSPEYSSAPDTNFMSIPCEGNLEDLLHLRKRLNYETGSGVDTYKNVWSFGYEIPPNTSTTNTPCFKQNNPL